MEASVRYRTRWTGLVLGLATTGALLAVGLAGCGGSAKATGGATPGGAPSGSQQQLQAYISCLNSHGVKIAAPSGRPTAFPSRSGGFPGFAGRSGRPTDRPTVRPSGGRSGFPGGGGGFGGGGGGGGFGGGIFGANGQPPAGVDPATWQAAQQACASVQPSFGGARGGRGGADSGANAAYLNCLRDHGAIPSSGPATSLNTADPAVAAALNTCAPLWPSGGPNPGSSPTG
jgi:hypothetical protein